MFIRGKISSVSIDQYINSVNEENQEYKKSTENESLLVVPPHLFQVRFMCANKLLDLKQFLCKKLPLGAFGIEKFDLLFDAF